METTTTKKNRVVIVRTSEGSKRDKDVVPIELRIEITPDKELGPITARDSEGNEYVVSIGLVSGKKGLCCCHNKKGKRICYNLPAGVKCQCKK